MNTNLNKELYEHWKSQKTCVLNPGLNVKAISFFKNENAILLHEDYESYLTLFNGFKNANKVDDWHTTDDEGFEFYSLDKEYLIKEKYLIFSYWTIGLVEYAICVDKTENNGMIIQTIDRRVGCYLAKNFSEFISLYLANDEALFSTTGKLISLI